MGGGGAQRPVWGVNEPKKSDAHRRKLLAPKYAVEINFSYITASVISLVMKKYMLPYLHTTTVSWTVINY
jgi:hypothetical protein